MISSKCEGRRWHVVLALEEGDPEVETRNGGAGGIDMRIVNVLADCGRHLPPNGASVRTGLSYSIVQVG
ncbi:hypothetical protein [Streptomyces sp. NPDC001635]|nr:hypothetical protein E4K10_46540 [Streptomyces sp. T1317-0309]